MSVLSASDLSGISGIVSDSRAVMPGFLFAALPGEKFDGRLFIGQAVANGAVAILAPEGTLWPSDVPRRPLFTVPDVRQKLAEIAAAFYAPLPDRLLAVTGTNGKTSTVDFLRQILTLAGRKAASVGTLGVIAPGRCPQGSLTTPDPISMAKILGGLKAEEIDDVAMEASSHGLDQRRLDGLRFNAAGFTNLTRDHLDYHGSMQAYGAAKLRLFSALLAPDAAIRVMADLNPEILAPLRRLAAEKKQNFELVELKNILPRPDGQQFYINGHDVELLLPGRFQADNAALAASLAEASGVENAFSYLPQLRGVRGRLERVLVLPNGATAYVDYAHTPDAVARVLSALRPHTHGRLHIVFGAGGDRDPGKRPLMGAAAAQGADVVIVTDDNPRSEEPNLIRKAILASCSGAIEIADRRAAIAAAVDGLKPGDVLVVAGKGHEQGQIIKGEVIPFDDASVLRECGDAA